MIKNAPLMCVMIQISANSHPGAILRTIMVRNVSQIVTAVPVSSSSPANCN